MDINRENGVVAVRGRSGEVARAKEMILETISMEEERRTEARAARSAARGGEDEDEDEEGEQGGSDEWKGGQSGSGGGGGRTQRAGSRSSTGGGKDAGPKEPAPMVSALSKANHVPVGMDPDVQRARASRRQKKARGQG